MSLNTSDIDAFLNDDAAPPAGMSRPPALVCLLFICSKRNNWRALNLQLRLVTLPQQMQRPTPRWQRRGL